MINAFCVTDLGTFPCYTELSLKIHTILKRILNTMYLVLNNVLYFFSETFMHLVTKISTCKWMKKNQHFKTHKSKIEARFSASLSCFNFMN